MPFKSGNRLCIGISNNLSGFFLWSSGFFLWSNILMDVVILAAADVCGMHVVHVRYLVWSVLVWSVHKANTACMHAYIK